jgi:hypothetical protein
MVFPDKKISVRGTHCRTIINIPLPGVPVTITTFCSSLELQEGVCEIHPGGTCFVSPVERHDETGKADKAVSHIHFGDFIAIFVNNDNFKKRKKKFATPSRVNTCTF